MKKTKCPLCGALSDTPPSVDGPIFKNTVMTWWNEEVAEPQGLAQIRAMTDDRWRSFKLRERQGLWKNRDEVVKAISDSPHLRGFNNRGWRMDFDFLVKNSTNYIRILEGSYKSRDKEPWE